MSKASGFFQKTKVVQTNVVETPSLVSEDPLVTRFYAQLSDREKIAHSIAVTKLGSSYDVTRTHGFLKWKKTHA